MPERVSGRSGPPSGGRVSGTPAACVSIAVAAAYRGDGAPRPQSLLRRVSPVARARSVGPFARCPVGMLPQHDRCRHAPRSRPGPAPLRTRVARLVARQVRGARRRLGGIDGRRGSPVRRGGDARGWLAGVDDHGRLLRAEVRADLARLRLVRPADRPIGPWRALARSAMVCLVVPAAVVGADRRGLDDIVLDTVVVNRAEGREA